MPAIAHVRTSDAPSWGMLALLAGLCVAGFAQARFRLAFGPAAVVAAGLLSLAAAAMLGRARAHPRLAAGATAFLQMSVFTILGVVLAFAMAAGAGPLQDGRLAAFDAALGIRWPDVFRAADRYPVAVWAGGIAYHSLTVQMVVGIVVLSATGRFDALRLAVAAAIMAGIVTILISGVVPALGNTFDPADYDHLRPSVAWADRDLVTGLREGSIRTVNLAHLTGIVSFPSYHAALPVILAWGQRGVPRMRVIAPAWAMLTIVATPLLGGHYAVDVLGGVILAVLAIALAPAIVRRKPAPAASTPAPTHWKWRPIWAKAGPLVQPRLDMSMRTPE